MVELDDDFCHIYLILAFFKMSVTGADECGAEEISDYNMPLRVGSIFIILCTSAIGVYLPIIAHRISPFSKGSIRDWLLTIGKFFGTGVILATAFVHMLPEALESFDSPCLSPGWQSYGAFGGVFCMIASFALQLIELGAVSKIEQHEKSIMDLESNPDTSSISSTAVNVPVQHRHDDYCKEKPGHRRGFWNDPEVLEHIGTVILEMGIMMHSLIVGITLANAGAEEFISLLIAIVFHQFFEGIALGTRINDMNIKGWHKPAVMGALFMITTPIGIAIGIGIHMSFNANSASSILSSAILDSLSAGILLYNGYITLMSSEMNNNQTFKEYPLKKKAILFVSMYCGAGLMALLGEWA
ncbi:Zinc/iron permease [Backusella circina FSU 941]|nr:Zinc/iron permease [Backusella circina FSU 941]